MRLREFRAIELAKLARIKKELLEKHPEDAERIRVLCDIIAAKLESLRAYTLADYIFTLYHASNEYPEFAELIPDERLVEELLKGGEE
mgnify:CR=1 FL=1